MFFCYSQGAEWYRLRKQVQQPMLKLTSINSYLPKQHQVAAQLVEIMKNSRDSNAEVPEMMNKLRKWALECKLIHPRLK